MKTSEGYCHAEPFKPFVAYSQVDTMTGEQSTFYAVLIVAAG